MNLLSNRDNVLQKWFDRTRNFAKQNRTNLVEQSPIVQIKEVNEIVFFHLRLCSHSIGKPIKLNHSEKLIILTVEFSNI